MFQILYESTYFWPYGETHTWCFIQPSLFQKLQLKAVFAHWGHLHLLSSSCSSSPSSSSCWPPDVLVPSSRLTSRPFSHRMGGWYYSEVHNAIYTQTANDTMQSMLSYRKKKKKKTAYLWNSRKNSASSSEQGHSDSGPNHTGSLLVFFPVSLLCK